MKNENTIYAVIVEDERPTEQYFKFETQDNELRVIILERIDLITNKEIEPISGQRLAKAIKNLED